MARPFKVETVHKQIYPATHNFKDDADGTEDDDITGLHNFSTTDTNGAVVIIASEDGHRKVAKISGDGDNGTSTNIYTDNEAETAGTIEFWIKYIDHGVGTFYLYFYDESFQAIGLMYINYGTNLIYSQYGNGAGGNTTVNEALPSDTWMHIKWSFDCATDKQSIWLDDVLEVDDENFRNDMTSTTFFRQRFTLMEGAGANTLEAYIDAIGNSFDTDYAIGDNVFWRHYKESTDDFESDDIGTQGTSITWVDTVLTTAATEIVEEFNEHKKIIRQIRSAGNDWSTHSFVSASTAGWFSSWIKSNDVTGILAIYLRESGTNKIHFRINGDKFQRFTAAAWGDVTGAPIPVDGTWYYLYIRWYADNTFDIWINNIQYEDGIANGGDFAGAGVDDVYLLTNTVGDYLYLDAPNCSLDSDSRGDNRTFDYNSDYTKTDITTDVKNVLYKNEIYKWREAILLSEISYENSEVFFKVYDVNSKLAIEAEIKKRDQISKDYTYSLRDKNQDDLEHRSSNTFTADDIHDPTDITSMLKVILPNLDHSDGDLILVNADTKTDTYSPTTQNYSDYEMLRDISDLANSVVIIEANGKCHLDDDLASGTALDLDTVADKDKMTEPPLVTDILEDINYFEIFGAMNPDTGTRFYKIIDNTGDDKKKSWRYTNNAFKNQTDVDAYAAALNNRTTTIKNIKFTAQSIGTHNMGETIDYKFIDALYNVPQANYYVIYEEINFDLNENTIILSEGMIENSKYGSIQPSPENYNDSYAAEIYETDINTVYLEMWNLAGATIATGIQLAAVGQYCQSHFRTSSKIDSDRDINITWSYGRGVIGSDTIAAQLWVSSYLLDGSAVNVINNWTAIVLPGANGIGTYDDYTHTITASDVDSDTLYLVAIKMNEAVRTIVVKVVDVVYYIKRG